MSSNEYGKIAPETLALYNNLREISRYSNTCTHWTGEEDWSGSNVKFSFTTEGAALKWFNTGVLTEQAHALSADQAAEGCTCRQRAVAMVKLPSLPLVKIPDQPVLPVILGSPTVV